MDCKEADGLIVAFVRGELPEAQAAALQAHLNQCDSCRWNVDAARNTLDLLKKAEEPDIVALVKGVLTEAIAAGASDVHYDPGREDICVRYRVDGVLHEIKRIPKDAYSAVVARVHTMAGMNPFELRVPQFGRIYVRREGHDYFIRATVLPSTMGQYVTLRILPDAADTPTLDQMGFAPEHLTAIRDLLRRPCGLLVLSGPTGSGKTTTAYACLKDIVHPEIAVFTIEDPVEVQIEGITQIHANHRAGLEYPLALKAFMQADPDVIFVADIPDIETGVAACNLALTGHLVLACLHADDAASTILRLHDLGLQPYTLGASLVGVVAQRLVRKVCPECKEEYDLPADEIAFLHQAGIADVPRRLWRGRGCDECRSTGYRGRMTINEVLVVDRDLMGTIAQGQYTVEIGRRAVQTSLVLDAAQKAVAGLTTVTEARRVTAGLVG